MQVTRGGIWYFILLLIAGYVWLFGQTWLDMERIWRTSATYNHCYLILPIAFWFLQRRRNDPQRDVNTVPNLRWLPVLIIALMILLWMLAFAADIALLMHVAAVLSLPALFWLIFGTESAARHKFALCYLIFLIPFGEELSLQLQTLTADMTVFMLRLADVPVFREGLYLATPVGLFEVAEACSGLRFLIASLAVSVLFAYLNYRRLAKQLIFVLFMAVLSLLANGVRAFMLVYIGEKSGMQYGFGADHYLYGWIFFGLVLLAGFWLGARFADADINFERQPIQLSPLTIKLPQITAVSLFVIAASYTLTLSEVSPPLTANSAINAPAQGMTPATDSDWGINFVNSLAQSHFTDDQQLEYFVAEYAHKQQQGELFSWENQLYDKKRWILRQRHDTDQYSLLYLTSLSGKSRTVLYWYQVGNSVYTKQLNTKVRQTLDYFTHQNTTAMVLALSVTGMDEATATQRLVASKHQLIALLDANSAIAKTEVVDD